MSKKPTTAYAFLDANIFLQFKDFDQIDWTEALGYRDVCLVVAPVISDEIEGFKYNNQSERLKKRSRLIAKKLDEIVSAASVGAPASIPNRANVTLLFIVDSPDLSKYPGLQDSVNDDRLIASALHFKEEHPEIESEDVILIADDTGARQRARARNLQVRKMEDQYCLPDEPTVDQRKIEELKRRIGELENKSPQLDLAFLVNQALVKDATVIVSSLFPDDFKDVDRLYESELKKVSWRNRVQNLSPTNPLSLMRLSVPAGEIEEYERNVRAYMEQYRAYLIEKALWKKARRSNQVIMISVSNLGSVPARSVVVRLRFPPGLIAYEHESVDEEYEDLVELQFDTRAPKRPEMPLKFQGLSWTVPPLESNALSGIAKNPDVYGPDIAREQDGSATVEQGLDKVPHKLSVTLSQFLIVAPDIKDDQRYEISYEIRADNIEPVDGYLVMHLRLT